jgi:hypothetical protein
MRAGDCFWAETGVDSNGNIQGHLFVVLLDPVEKSRNTVTVPCSTIRSRNYDTACELMPGDHEFIVVRSYVRYHLAEIECVDDIEKKIEAKEAKMKSPIKIEILKRIRKGLIKSKYTKKRVKEWYHQQYLDNLI